MRRRALLGVILCSAAASPLAAQKDLLSGARAALQRGGFPVTELAPVPVPEADPPQEDGFSVPSCGLFGSLCGGSLSGFSFSAAKGPLQTGFMALGRAGKTGSVDGPGRQGNGTYRVEQNDPYALKLRIDTGYVEGTVTLARDQSSGRDTLAFNGRYWDQARGAWGPQLAGSNEVLITYDARGDSGKIRWQENGAWKEERYWGGKAGRTSMTIELAGGWDHDFKQD